MLYMIAKAPYLDERCRQLKVSVKFIHILIDRYLNSIPKDAADSLPCLPTDYVFSIFCSVHMHACLFYILRAVWR